MDKVQIKYVHTKVWLFAQAWLLFKIEKKMYQLDGFLFQIVVLQQITKINKN